MPLSSRLPAVSRSPQNDRSPTVTFAPAATSALAIAFTATGLDEYGYGSPGLGLTLMTTRSPRLTRSPPAFSIAAITARRWAVSSDHADLRHASVAARPANAPSIDRRVSM